MKTDNLSQALSLLSILLVILGGLNLGLIGAAGIDLVGILSGDDLITLRIFYLLAGISALYLGLSSLVSIMKSESLE